LKGYWPNTKSPETINEVLLKKKLTHGEELGPFVDKIRVRDYIEQISKEKDMDLNLPEIIQIYNTLNDLKIENIREKVFIKANHGSGMNILFDPHKTKNILAVKKDIERWFHTDYSLLSGERCYATIPVVVYCEKPLYCRDGSLPDDIKVHCYCGNAVVIQVIRRTSGALERKTYDRFWTEQNWFENEILKVDVNKLPKEKIIQYSEILSKDFDYVRVDFYEVDGVLYFSELTFFPMSAALPLKSKEVDLYLGNLYLKICQNSSLPKTV
jgi:hypothetical protein